jgi:hypothetical protein
MELFIGSPVRDGEGQEGGVTEDFKNKSLQDG